MSDCCSNDENDICVVESRLISPETYMKIINHERRQSILHALHKMTLDRPTTKKEIAEEIDIEYSKINYQLNKHLSDFWDIEMTEKVRGTVQEYIAPENPNSIYINVGQDQLIFNVDPLANLYGKIGTVGTRCDQCSEKQRERCMDEVMGQSCFTEEAAGKIGMEEILDRNNRKKPYTPIDHMVICELSKIIDGNNCVMKIRNGCCEFIENVKEKEA